MENNTNQPKHTASEKDLTPDIKEEFPTLASDNKANIIQTALTEQNSLNQTSMDIDEDKKIINNINTTSSPPPTTTTTTTSLPSTGIPQNECNILTPTLADILSDDLMLRFYQCVKDIRLQRSPTQTSSMFFALCHALGDTISFLKVPNMNKIMFRQDEQIFAVNISGIIPPVSDNNNNNNNNNQSLQQSADNLNVLANVHYNNTNNNNNITPVSSSSATTSNQYTQMDNNNNNTESSSSTTSTLAAAAAAAANFFSANDQSQQLLQAALSTVNSHDPNHPLLPNVLNPVSEGSSNISGAKSKTPKKPKKPSPRDKEYAVRRNEIIQDLLKVTEANLLHQANTVDEDIKLIIQGQERNTKLGLLSPLHRFATFANLTAHYDSDFAPKNAGVYYNYEYFQLFLAFRDLELERTQQMQQHKQQQNESVSKHASSAPTSSPSLSTATSSSTTTTTAASTPPVNYTTTSLSRPVMTQCRADIEKVLVNTNWEAIRRRLIIGERIYQLSNVIGRGFLLLSKQVSGRKLLHNFNTTEWTLLLHEFERPESLPLLRVLQTKYSPERLYQHHHPENAIYSQGMTESAAAAAAAEAMKVLPLLSQSQQQPSQNNISTASLASSSSSSSPSKAYVDSNNNSINNNDNASDQAAPSNNYSTSLPHTTTTTTTLTAASMVPENIPAINSEQQENNNDNNHISNNNSDFYQNIKDHQDGNRRKKLKTKE